MSIYAILGGVCIGIGAMLLMVLNGRIAGISGIFYQSFDGPKHRNWALFFLAGLCLGVVIHLWASGDPGPVFDMPLSTLLPGAFLVGVGTRMGSGCTSGHGICGIARFSRRSIVATIVFMGSAFITVFVQSLVWEL
ncbi:MAG TPA: YeeE/YedE family protein [Gammaproteobacteria bacterium]|nr:YeeE/YedE family protein [Gammaproteobacteria bacterium]HIK69106.1 YeeE/YedE family protein [Pseudomonadales bacterium]